MQGVTQQKAEIILEGMKLLSAREGCIRWMKTWVVITCLFTTAQLAELIFYLLDITNYIDLTWSYWNLFVVTMYCINRWMVKRLDNKIQELVNKEKRLQYRKVLTGEK